LRTSAATTPGRLVEEEHSAGDQRDLDYSARQRHWRRLPIGMRSSSVATRDQALCLGGAGRADERGAAS
jgi:hypothetical protein